LAKAQKKKKRRNLNERLSSFFFSSLDKVRA